jgi:hypothetical protein
MARNDPQIQPEGTEERVWGWSDERLREELEAFVVGQHTWPLAREFREAGRSDLRMAMSRRGGTARWAPLLGFQARAAGGGQRVWTDARIDTELTHFTAGRTTWPTQAEFRAAGQAALYAATSRHHGLKWWAQKLGLGQVKSRGREATWTDERIKSGLRPLLDGLQRWPRKVEFERAGLMNLYFAVQRYGGPARWAPRFGLKAPKPGRPRRHG